MYNFGNYKSNKETLAQQIESSKVKILELKDYGIDASETLGKLNNALKMLNDDKISVVLVGAFSDGKTSVAAGWMNEKLDNMKISSDESSDEILSYVPSAFPDDCQIIDTPGLFGDKIGSDENGAKIELSTMTKKYISEANIILYVVTAKNPIKDSHKECVRWILNDLNKASSTIFVINRMDDVADLTDEDDFNTQMEIKIDNLLSKLRECGISEKGIGDVKVACISAAPDGKGVEEWKLHREVYLERSRLLALDNMIVEVLKNSKEALITKTGCDILNDEMNKILNLVFEYKKNLISVVIPEKKEGLEINEKSLESLRKSLMMNKKNMIKNIKDLRRKKVNRIATITLENFEEIFRNEIGKDGVSLQEDIDEIFQEFSDNNIVGVISVKEKFEKEHMKQNETMNKVIKESLNMFAFGAKNVSGVDTNTIKNGIFAGRDILSKINVDVKFKPWQVTKIANVASEMAPVIGGGIDVFMSAFENIQLQNNIKKMKEAKSDIIDDIEKIFKDINGIIKDDKEYLKSFAPGFDALRLDVESERKEFENTKIIVEKLNEWESDVETMSVIIE